MFIVTPEFREFLDETNELIEVIKEPRSIFAILFIGSFITILYFSIILLADLI
jgi:hypothetical protein